LASIVAQYYPLIRGLQMQGYMFDPRSDWFSLYVSTTPAFIPLNYVVYCEHPGPLWTAYAEGTTSPDLVLTWTGLSCLRVYVLVGMAAPNVETVGGESTGQVLTVRLSN
jgi:hypothetical protein